MQADYFINGGIRKDNTMTQSKKQATKIPNKYIGIPLNGWKERTWYLVEVAFHPDNCIHRAMFFTGFLNGKDNGPGGYNCLVSIGGCYEDEQEIKDVFYLVVIKKLFSEEDLNSKDFSNTPRMLQQEQALSKAQAE
jgi:hypothetical protein